MQSTDKETVHLGRNVKRLREMLGIKQDVLALELNVTQQTVSLIEQRETIDDGLLEQISKILKVPVEAIKNFDQEKAINVISNNTFENCAQPASIFYNSTINPIEEWMKALEENKKLYERLLASEREKVEMLQRLLEERK